MPIIVCIMLFFIMYFFLKNNNENMYQDEIEYVYCNKCGEKVNGLYDSCPHCKDKLKEECHHCKKMIHVNWRYCPYCGTTKEIGD